MQDVSVVQSETVRVLETFVGARKLWPEGVQDVQLRVHSRLPVKEWFPEGDPTGVRVIDAPYVLAKLSAIVDDEALWEGRALPQRMFMRAMLAEAPETPDEFRLSDEELEARAPAPEYA